jgi:hypothetical protein
MIDVKLGHIVCENGKNYEVIYFKFEIIFVFFHLSAKI